MQASQLISRLAPSPTGKLHLGNAWSFLLAWLFCRLEGGKIYLRMEDIDPQRSKQEYASDIIQDLKWLGLDWDSFEGKTEVLQSEHFDLYEENIHKLGALVYPCFCTRKELRDLAGAPQETQKAFQGRFIMPDMGAPYPKTCRFLSVQVREEKIAQHKSFSLRLACPPLDSKKEVFTFNDLVLGQQEFSLTEIGGDFALRRSDGVWAYQLAVVSDDKAMGINHIVRGEDILTSTPRQLYLFSLLRYDAPKYAHIPLLLDEKGERLAKRHDSMSLAYIREKQEKPSQIITYFAKLMGFEGQFYHAQALLDFMKAKQIKTFPWSHLKKYHDTKGIVVQDIL